MPDSVNQEELLTEFWEIAHKTYFRPLGDQDKETLAFIRAQVLADNHEDGLTYVPVFMDEEAIDAIAAMISSKYESVYGPGYENLSRQNFANMTKQYYLAMHFYLPLLVGNKEVDLLHSDSISRKTKYACFLQEKVLRTPATMLEPRNL